MIAVRPGGDVKQVGGWVRAGTRDAISALGRIQVSVGPDSHTSSGADSAVTLTLDHLPW